MEPHNLEGRALVSALEEAERQGRVRSQTHPELPLRIWNYTREAQYERDWGEVTLRARALVTDEEGQVSSGMPKFFNATEPDAPQLEPGVWFEVYPKLDGSLIQVFRYERKTVVTSKGSFTSWHARQGRRLLEEKYGSFSPSRAKTYLFELIHPSNRIVVDYGHREELVLLETRNPFTSERLPPAPEDPFPFAEPVMKGVWYAQSLGHLRQWIPEGKEGWVIRAGDKTVKLKSEEYVRLHRIVSDLSKRRVWEYLKEGRDLGKLLEGVPDEYDEEIRQMAREIRYRFSSLKKHYQSESAALAAGSPLESKEDRKQTALNYQDSSLHTGALFQCLLGRDSFDEWCWQEVKPEPEIQH